MRTLLALLICAPAFGTELTVAAASDLAPLENDLRQAFGSPVRFSFASSGSLLRQVENGAPFDVYLSASEQYVTSGIAQGVLSGPATCYAIGRLALWSPSGSIKDLRQLPALQHVAIANPAYAPYGAAAKDLLTSTGLWTSVQPRIVYGENIRQTLQYAESGNVDAAIVSWSLVHNRGGVLLKGPGIRQSGAAVTSSGNPSEARRFLKFLTSPAGQEVFRAHGLFPASE